MLVENLKEASLIAQRQVYDAIIAKGGVLKIDVTREMLTYATQSHSRYHECLKRKREQVSDEERKAKERKRAAESIKILEEKRLQLKEKMKDELNDINRNIVDLKCQKSKL